ncbi:hypothetical protein PV326_001051 [Microctonus aethiopoides]|nr:hypothetical protein PV326_001051 [Microctonus aethiopoides]
MKKRGDPKIILTGSKNPEKMLLKKNHKLITPLINNWENTDIAFNFGIQQHVILAHWLIVSPDLKTSVRVGSTTGQSEIRMFKFELSQPISAVWKREEDDRRI